MATVQTPAILHTCHDPLPLDSGWGAPSDKVKSDDD
jgi:hypothetical protein